MYFIKNKKINLIILFLVALAFSEIVFALDFGCCCNPVTFSGNIEEKADCYAKLYYFTNLPSFGNSCDDVCHAKFFTHRQAVCGDKICEGDEFNTCPSDCAAPVPDVIACGSTDYAPAPVDFVVSPVKGEKKFRLSFRQVCPASYVQVLRSDNGRTFEYIAQVRGNSFVDDDSSLEWNKEYTYNIFSYYVFSGKSSEVSSEESLGDIECWDNSLPVFCLNHNFYYKFENYLKDKGYVDKYPTFFDLNFITSVNSVFSSKFNKAYSCSDVNLLIPVHSCLVDQSCAIKNSVPICIDIGPCNNSGVFGMFSTVNSCEIDQQNPKFCFFDNSKTIVDSCYECLAGMACYDYKSDSSCIRDNCGVGACEWHPVIDDLGIGVCVDSRQSNCLFCNKTGSKNAPNLDAFNNVFNICEESKANALSVFDFPCFYSRDEKRAMSCDEVTCLSYSELQCGSPSSGIRLNNDNSFLSRSTDMCRIGVCQFDSVAHKCMKNADGSLSDDWADCEIDDVECEADFSQPITSLIPSGEDNVDFLNIVIMDKQSRFDSMRNHAGENGFETFLCLRSGGESCQNARTYSMNVKSNKLILKNLALKDGQRKIADLKKGSNTLFFYSKDNHSNIEIIKNISFIACDDCQGPTLLSARISGGKPLGSVLYSSIVDPIVTLIFDEPTSIISASLSGSPASVIFGSGFKYEHSFSFSSVLGEGSFRFLVQAENAKHISIPDSGLLFSILINTSLIQVDVLPEDGSLLSSKDVDFDLAFSNCADLQKVILTHITSKNKFFLNKSSRDITKDFTSVNDLRFFANLTGLNFGAYKLYFEAEDRNSLPIARETGFFISGVDSFINLITPKLGVSPTQVFTAEFETGLMYDECRYAFDLPVMPDVDVNDLPNYPLASTSNKYVHKTGPLSISYGDKGKHSLYVFCKDGSDIDSQVFNLSADPSPPVIVNAYAFPKVIAEEYMQMPGQYATSIKVETDKDSFCKFSSSTTQFDLMEDSFVGFDVYPKKSHSVFIVVDQPKSYSYFVVCKSPAGVISASKKVDFSVNLNLPFVAKIVTDFVSDDLDFVLGVETNKMALCYFGETPFSITTPFGIGVMDYVHRQDISVEEEGSYDFFVSCSVPRTGEKSKVIKATVIVDQTPPVMLWVNDSSRLPDPEVSFFADKLGLSFLGNDSETDISKYFISVKKSLTGVTIKNRSVSKVLNAGYTYVENLSLENFVDYDLIVEAVDKAGLLSLPMSSDGVFVNISAEPSECSNGIKDGNETGVDCGGLCSPCSVGVSCIENSDCESNVCLDEVCVAKNFSCDNGIKDGDETDVDCGGPCVSCENGKDCYDDSDCESDNCDVSSGVCKEVPSCEDGRLSAGETDVDCGGPCVPCSSGMNCEVDSDCSPGLFCEGMVCFATDMIDNDHDGVIDSKDICPGTPEGEIVDANGCGASQKYSVGDIINDAWRLKYFACVECPEAAGNFDFDKDGLTNLQEFQYGTDPSRKDSDRDGWTDYEEIEQGTNPLDSKDHPEGGSGFLGFFLIILIILGAGVGGYLLYNKLKEKGFDFKIPKRVKTHKSFGKEPQKTFFVKKDISHPKFSVPLSPLDKKIAELKKFAKTKETSDKDWLDLGHKKKSASAGVFEKMKESFGVKKKQSSFDLSKKKNSSKPNVVFDKLKKTVEEHKRKKIEGKSNKNE